MSAGDRWVLATGNAGKLREFAALLAPAGLRLVSSGELQVPPAPELADTFVENALGKARHASAATALPAIADDSGLLVGALGDAPGLRSARYAGEAATDADNVQRLLAALDGVPPHERGARFVCILVALRGADDPDPLVARGVWHGRIATAARGSGGFGYDPVFEIDGSGRCAAELTPAQKHAASHRGDACRQLLKLLGTR